MTNSRPGCQPSTTICFVRFPPLPFPCHYSPLVPQNFLVSSLQRNVPLVLVFVFTTEFPVFRLRSPKTAVHPSTAGSQVRIVGHPVLRLWSRTGRSLHHQMVPIWRGVLPVCAQGVSAFKGFSSTIHERRRKLYCGDGFIIVLHLDVCVVFVVVKVRTEYCDIERTEEGTVGGI